MKSPKDQIISLPKTNLRKKSKKVILIDKEIQKLAEQMEKATLDWEDNRDHEVGVALAAVQINKMQRVVVIRKDFDNKDNREFNVYINPEVVKYEGLIREDYEGCLSIPEIYGKVPRYTKVKIKALDIRGKVVRVTAKGFLARVFQHEIDHTNGIVFIDHIKDNPESFYHLSSTGKLEKLDYSTKILDNKDLW